MGDEGMQCIQTRGVLTVGLQYDVCKLKFVILSLRIVFRFFNLYIKQMAIELYVYESFLQLYYIPADLYQTFQSAQSVYFLFHLLTVLLKTILIHPVH